MGIAEQWERKPSAVHLVAAVPLGALMGRPVQAAALGWRVGEGSWAL